MSTIRQAIEQKKKDSAGALIGYLPLGFPDYSTSVEAAVALAEHGVDILECGIAYSDPVMDGPVIQRATRHVLQQKFSLENTLGALGEIASRVQIPVTVMTYWNLVFHYGVDRFAKRLHEMQIAGMITPDLIPDEASEWIHASDTYQLDRIFLAAPNSNAQRLEYIVNMSRGFVYAVSTMGVTGARERVDAVAKDLVARLKEAGSQATCVGVGVSKPQHISDILEYADGVIVGSAFVQALERGGIPELVQCVTDLAQGTR